MSEKDDEQEYDYEAQQEYIGEQYRFYVTELDSDDSEARGYSMWVENEAGEFPVLTNTGGLNYVNSATRATEGRLDVSDPEAFANAVGYSFHSCISFARLDEERIEETIDLMYDEQEVPDHERWAVHLIVGHLMGPRDIFPELEPLAEYANQCTEFGVPGYEG